MKFAGEAAVLVVPPAIVALAAISAYFILERGYLLALAIVFAVIAGAVLLFFRDPTRIVPEDENLVLAPADGRVLLADTLQDGRKRIAIFMSVFNVHINRCPVSGVVQKIEDKPGTYFNAASDEAAQKNARVDVFVEAKSGPVAWRQISGLIARKISCRLKPGDTVHAGDRFGLIYFGSRMEVYLPVSAVLITRPGKKVRAGECIIAKLS
jgi:phosphatidylserine decarboxylase